MITSPVEARHPKCSQESSSAAPNLKKLKFLSNLSFVLEVEETLPYSRSSRLSLYNALSTLSTNPCVQFDFVLTVSQPSSHASWRRVYNIKELYAFQDDLRNKLDHSHECIAECPWIDAFIKFGFLPPTIFSTMKEDMYDGLKNKNQSQTMHQKGHELNRVLQTLQRVLLNPRNHDKCSVLSGPVVETFLDFLCGSRVDSRETILLSPAIEGGDDSDRCISRRHSSTNSLNDDSMQSSQLGKGSYCCAMCALHSWKDYSDELIFQRWNTPRKTNLKLHALTTAASRLWRRQPKSRLRSSTQVEQSYYPSRKPELSKTAIGGYGDEISLVKNRIPSFVAADEGTPEEPYPQSPRTSESEPALTRQKSGLLDLVRKPKLTRGTSQII